MYLNVPSYLVSLCDKNKLKMAEKQIKASNEVFLKLHPNYESEDCCLQPPYKFIIQPTGIGDNIFISYSLGNIKWTRDIGDYENF